MRWAADPAGPPVWQTWLPSLIGAVVVAVITTVGTIVIQRMKRRLDDATTDKTTAEGRKAQAETVSIEVATARSLIAEVRAMMAEQKADYAAHLSEQDERIKALTERMSAGEEQQRALRAAFSAHETWDRDAVAALRTAQPDWPDPPPVTFD